MPIFEDTKFLLITDEPALEKPGILELQSLIQKNGGSWAVRSPNDSKGSIEDLSIDHIISETFDFAEYQKAVELFIPITLSEWISASDANKQKKNYRLYSPEPKPFMDKVVLCVCDNIPQGDKELMYAGARAFGGQFLDALSTHTTHLVAVDLSNNKSIVAANIKKAEESMKIQIVLPKWIDDCIRTQRHVDEKPYLLSDPIVLQTGHPNFSESDKEAAGGDRSTVLARKRVHLATDYNLSENLRASIYSLIEHAGGSVCEEFDPSKIDIFIIKHRESPNFKECQSHSQIAVASLEWLYHVITTNVYVLPLNSSLLHFPTPLKHLPEFRELRISITGISGDARFYLTTLLTAMGATFTKTLDGQNDFLVCSQARGEKYEAAKSRWKNIKIVNYLWVEECYAKWQYCDPHSSRYTSLSPAQALGVARISARDLLQWSADGSEHLGIEDSNAEEHDANAGEAVEVSTTASSDPPTGEDDAAEADAKLKQKALEEDSADVLEVGYIKSAPANSPTGRASRSAKQKASLKLHSDMEDLNQYTSMSKSSRMMKSYMEDLERQTETKARKRPESPEVPEGNHGAPKKKKKIDTKVAGIVAVMTGCELFVTLHRADVVKLSKAGVQILGDYGAKKNIDTIIAPKILRTEKFLKSLTKAKQILHPSYVKDILKRLSSSELTWEELSKEFKPSDYSLDKVTPVKQINQDLGVTLRESCLPKLLKQPAGDVFEGVSLNLSQNLNGGADLIASILKEHGLSHLNIVKLSAGLDTTQLLTTSEQEIILVAHKTKDLKVAASLTGVTVVDWDWCVKSIFQRDLLPRDKFLVA